MRLHALIATTSLAALTGLSGCASTATQNAASGGAQATDRSAVHTEAKRSRRTMTPRAVSYKVVNKGGLKEREYFDPVCDSKCSGSVTSVYAYDHSVNGDGQCVLQFSYPCEPFGCDGEGKTCATSCTSNADCSANGACNVVTSECVTRGNICQDAFAILTPDATEVSCSPYKCVAGACQQQCGINGDCAPGYHCNKHFCEQ